jgi:uncharacterized metal-binding protein YceD (DUF177 family)
MTDRPPYTSLYDLGNVPEKGAELVLKPAPAELSQITAWLGIESLERLEATIRLSRGFSGRYLYQAHFEADVVQACVVTLEPVLSHLSEDFGRSLELVVPVSRHRRHAGKEAAKPEILPPDIAADDDAPELIDNPVIDLAAPLLEELSLSLDPYPRKAGVSFTPPEDAPETPAENPFSVLQKLKQS